MHHAAHKKLSDQTELLIFQILMRIIPRVAHGGVVVTNMLGLQIGHNAVCICVAAAHNHVEIAEIKILYGARHEGKEKFM